MQVRKLAVTGVVGLASFTALGLSTPAYALCDSYSGGCATTPPTSPPTGGEGFVGNDEQPAAGVDQPAGGTTDQPGSGDQTPVQGTGGRPAGAGTTPASAPATLPFTGGELVLMTAVGVGALAGGTALVIAGRRRTATA